MTDSIIKRSLMSKTASLLLSFLLLISVSGVARSVVTTYTDEATYLAALSAYVKVSESFESNAWDSVRSAVLNPQAAPSINNLGLTWQHRFSSNGGVTTSDGGGDVHDGNWQFYAYPHGGYSVAALDCTVAGECGDGFTITSAGAGTLYGVGGWFTGVSGPEIKFNLDGNLIAGAGGKGVGNWQFYGVIDTAGFTTAGIWDNSGTGGDQNLIFADDFTIGVTTFIPPPSGNLQFNAPTYSVTENGTTATITVERVGGSYGTVGVDYDSSDGSATAGIDYTNASGTLSLADGVMSAFFSVAITDDMTYEGNETVSFTLSNPTGGANLATQSSAVLTITEDDVQPSAGNLQFDMASYAVAENVATATINIRRTGGSFGAASVDYTITDGTANAGSDYTAANSTVNFTDGDALTKSFSITIINSPGTYEGDETVNLALSNATGAVLGAPATATLTITENDLVPVEGSVQFSAPTYTVAEDGVTVLINVTRTGASGGFGAASVDYVITDGSANTGSDYTASNGSVSFAAGDAVAKSFSITIINSAGTYEGDETVNLALSNATGASLGAPATATLTITENDLVPVEGSLQFSAATYSVAENGVSAIITVARVGGTFGAVSVDYSSIAGGSAAVGSDYVAVNGSLNFADGVLSQTFSVGMIDDAVYEGDETVNLLLSNVSGASLGIQSSAVLTISENEEVPPPGSLQFSTPIYSKNENGATATITVTRVGGGFGIVGVDYASSDGTAVAGSDYTAVSGSLSFADGIVSQTFSIDIIDDADYEGDESLSLSLSNPTGGAGLGSPALAILTITEDDPVPPAGSLQFSAVNYNVAENGITATITVTRTGGSFSAVGVDYASADSSATAGSDYTAVSASLSFADGVVSQTFSIDIIDDADYEGDESLSLSLSNPTGGAGLGGPALAILTITEDDPVPPAGSLQFSAVSYNVAENGITATITVTRTGGSFGAVGVDYASADGTATAGSDYTAVSSSVSFADGVVNQTFSIDIIDDADYEGDESLSLSLSNPTGGAGLGSPALAIITITEDDPVPPSGSLQFSAPSYSVAENGVSATITVTRTGGSFGTVGVDYATSDGPAKAGSDYTATNGSLSFADGILSQTFNVTILDDITYEGDEMLKLTLSAPTGGAGLSKPNIAALIVLENDPFSDTRIEPNDNNNGAGGGGSSSFDLITLVLLISLYRLNLRSKRYALY